MGIRHCGWWRYAKPLLDLLFNLVHGTGLGWAFTRPVLGACAWLTGRASAGQRVSWAGGKRGRLRRKRGDEIHSVGVLLASEKLIREIVERSNPRSAHKPKSVVYGKDCTDRSVCKVYLRFEETH